MTVRNYFIEKIPMIEKSFYEYFLEIIKQFGNAIALIDPETMKSFTYLELINQSEQMRNALIRLGIQFGDTIDEIGKYFKKASVKWILTEEKLFEKIQHLKEENIKETLLYYTLQCYLNNDKSFWNNEMINNIQNKLIYDYNTVSNNFLFVRNNRFAKRNPFNKTQGIKCGKYEMVNLSGTDVVYGVLPYFHAGGLLTVLSLLGLGVQIIINRKFDAEQFLGTLSNYQVTTALLVPPVLKFLADTPGLNSEALHSLKYIFVGSAHVNESLVEMYMVQQKLVLSFSCNRYFWKKKLEVAEFYYQMLNANNDECEEKEIGEIWLKTSTMMQGYLERTTDTNDAFIDGWYRTGDLGYYDFDQFIYITGRIKEMIKVRGWQVSPYEIEEKIQELEDVELCAVVGIPDEYSGQLPKAYIQLHDGCQPDENTIHRLKYISK
uniref:AMP-dependent synthetase/ligase domain-containing protein n=1 Tax=Wuchereria bancrofti TaxID=6293 RepID=A0A1I8EJQ2_WUCBA